MVTWNTNLNGFNGELKEVKTEISLTEIEFLKAELAKKNRKTVRLENKIKINEDLIAQLNSSNDSWKTDYDNVLRQSRAKDTELNNLQGSLNSVKFKVLPEWLTYKDIVDNQILILPYSDSLWLFKKLDILIKNIKFHTREDDKIYNLKGTYKFPKNSYIGLNIQDNLVKKDGIFLIDSNNQISYYCTAHSTNNGNMSLCATYKKHIESISDYLHAIFYIKMEFGTINLGSPYEYKEFTPGFKKIFNKVIIEAIQFAPNEAMNGDYLRTNGETNYDYYRHIKRSDLIVREEEMEDDEDCDNEDDDEGYYDEND